ERRRPRFAPIPPGRLQRLPVKGRIIGPVPLHDQDGPGLRCSLGGNVAPLVQWPQMLCNPAGGESVRGGSDPSLARWIVSLPPDPFPLDALRALAAEPLSARPIEKARLG